MVRPHFRVEDLEIWRLAQELAIRFHHVADNLEQRKLFRFAEQLRAAGLSVSNNIAEGCAGGPREREHAFEGVSAIPQHRETIGVRERVHDIDV